MIDARPRKRSLTLHGHRTSVSLEDPFWLAFVRMARRRGLSINALAADIDRQRGISAGLASAIRVAILIDLQNSLSDAGLLDDDTGEPVALGVTGLQIDGSDGA